MAHQFFATCPKGLEQLLADELQQLHATAIKQTVAGVFFEASIEDGYKICLWSRFANRILYLLATFPVTTADDLYNGAKKINWFEHMTAHTTFRIDFNGTTDELKHTQFSAQKVKDAIVDKFRQKQGDRPSVDKVHPMLRINAVLRKGKVSISLDFSGESLHRRGYRTEGGEAPLKENLAAAILQRAKWPEILAKGGCLVDPMCGSGTLLIEGLMMAADIAPGINRTFGFQGWRQFREHTWTPLLVEANARAKKGKQQLLTNFYGFDVNEEAITMAKANIERAGLGPFIHLEVLDIKYLTAQKIKKTFGLVVCNPPYGERLEEEETLLPLYRMLTYKLKENFLNWEAAVFTGNTEVARNMGLRAYKKYPMFNGSIPCQLLLFHITPEWFIRY